MQDSKGHVLSLHTTQIKMGKMMILLFLLIYLFIIFLQIVEHDAINLKRQRQY